MRIYFDHNATTPVSPEVLEAVREAAAPGRSIQRRSNSGAA